MRGRAAVLVAAFRHALHVLVLGVLGRIGQVKKLADLGIGQKKKKGGREDRALDGD